MNRNITWGTGDEEVTATFTRKELLRIASCIRVMAETPGGPRDEVVALQELRQKVKKLIDERL